MDRSPLLLRSVTLSVIALGSGEEPTSKPSSKEFVLRSGIASGSIENTITPLLENDFIARDRDNKLCVVDPAVAEIARSIA